MWDFANSILNACIFRVLHCQICWKDIGSGVEVRVRLMCYFKVPGYFALPVVSAQIFIELFEQKSDFVYYITKFGLYSLSDNRAANFTEETVVISFV